MDIEKTIQNGIGTIYHEIGHLFAYLLAGMSNDTTLGSIRSFETGLQKNCVIPEEFPYHINNPIKDKVQIEESTKNIKRTIAWFIEVISGCTFQCLKEDKHFDFCFGIEDSKLGKIDFSNLSVIRNISSFTWTFDDIYALNNEYTAIIKKHNVIQSLESLVNEISTKLLIHPHQISITNEDLDELCRSIETVNYEELLKEYMELVDRYYNIFNCRIK